MRQSIMRQLRPLPTSQPSTTRTFLASSLFSVTDADGDFIAKYQVFDSTSDPSSGYWAINGVAQGSNVAIDVTAAQLASTTFQSGSGSDDLWVRANDGTAWGAWKEFHVQRAARSRPCCGRLRLHSLPHQNILASSLFSRQMLTVTSIAKYQVFDSTSDPSSGHWSINEVVQGTNVAIDVTADQLASTTFQSGSGADQLYVRASDGMLLECVEAVHGDGAGRPQTFPNM